MRNLFSKIMSLETFYIFLSTVALTVQTMNLECFYIRKRRILSLEFLSFFLFFLHILLSFFLTHFFHVTNLLPFFPEHLHINSVNFIPPLYFFHSRNLVPLFIYLVIPSASLPFISLSS